MKKIPTLFLRDPARPQNLLREYHPDALRVIRTTGTLPTRKYDGQCVRVLDGKLWRRHAVKAGKREPEEFEFVDYDPITGKTTGWVPADPDDPADQYILEAWESTDFTTDEATYEAIGPKIRTNSDHAAYHTLVRHDLAEVIHPAPPTTYLELEAYLKDFPHEGIVWQSPDGPMCKIKVRDFHRSGRR